MGRVCVACSGCWACGGRHMRCCGLSDGVTRLPAQWQFKIPARVCSIGRRGDPLQYGIAIHDPLSSSAGSNFFSKSRWRLARESRSVSGGFHITQQASTSATSWTTHARPTALRRATRTAAATHTSASSTRRCALPFLIRTRRTSTSASAAAACLQSTTASECPPTRP